MRETCQWPLYSNISDICCDWHLMYFSWTYLSFVGKWSVLSLADQCCKLYSMAFDPSKAGEHDERCPGILKYSPRLSISYSSWSKILAYSGYLWNVSWFHATQTMIFEQNQGKPMGTWWYPSTDAMDNFFSFRSFLVLLVFRFQSERKIPLTSWISTGSDESSMPLPLKQILLIYFGGPEEFCYPLFVCLSIKTWHECLDLLLFFYHK